MAYGNELFSDMFSREIEREPIERLSKETERTTKKFPSYDVRDVKHPAKVRTKVAGISYYEQLCQEQGLLGFATAPWNSINIFPESKKR